MLLNELDPNGVQPGEPDGAPLDEYLSEAHLMASLLINTGSITIDQTDVIWQKAFCEPLSGIVGAIRAKQFAASLNALIESADPP